MTAITQTTQLNLFSTFQTVFLANSTLAQKFNTRNIYEFEPNLKGLNAQSLPYIVVSVPQSDSEPIVLNNTTLYKDFIVNVMMVMDYAARSNWRTYANALIRALEAADSSFQSIGYRGIVVDSASPRVELINENQVITGDFTVNFKGYMAR